MEPASEFFLSLKSQAPSEPDTANPAAAAMLAASANSNFVDAAVAGIVDGNGAALASLSWAISGFQEDRIYTVQLIDGTNADRDPQTDTPEILPLFMIGSGLALFSCLKIGNVRRTTIAKF
jgi:hypothetical protein